VIGPLVGRVAVVALKPLPPEPGPLITLSPPTIVCAPAVVVIVADGELETEGAWKWIAPPPPPPTENQLVVEEVTDPPPTTVC